MTQLFFLWLGGCLAMLPLTFGTRAATGGQIDRLDLVGVLCWPIVIIAFVVDVAKGWRP